MLLDDFLEGGGGGSDSLAKFLLLLKECGGLLCLFLGKSSFFPDELKLLLSHRELHLQLGNALLECCENRRQDEGKMITFVKNDITDVPYLWRFRCSAQGVVL